jgi:hypothetical protein
MMERRLANPQPSGGQYLGLLCIAEGAEHVLSFARLGM